MAAEREELGKRVYETIARHLLDNWKHEDGPLPENIEWDDLPGYAQEAFVAGALSVAIGESAPPEASRTR